MALVSLKNDTACGFGPGESNRDVFGSGGCCAAAEPTAKITVAHAAIITRFTARPHTASEQS